MKYIAKPKLFNNAGMKEFDDGINCQEKAEWFLSEAAV